eukprot:COSAG01_NODE_938_length_12628_cov_8.320137_4_plen_104_part_00
MAPLRRPHQPGFEGEPRQEQNKYLEIYFRHVSPRAAERTLQVAVKVRVHTTETGMSRRGWRCVAHPSAVHVRHSTAVSPQHTSTYHGTGIDGTEEEMLPLLRP